MSGEILELEVGQVMPHCPIPLRPDGSCHHAAHVLDPVTLAIVLGVDVSPEQEQAIMDACRPDEGSRAPALSTDDASRRRLWVWDAMTDFFGPAIGLALLLRPGRIQWPVLHWNVTYAADQLCEEHAREIGEDARSMAEVLCPLRGTKGMHARILLVGRDHRLLGISHVACHGEISFLWMTHLFAACWQRLDPEHAGPPPVPPEILCHIVGQSHTMDPQATQAWLLDHGWQETKAQKRLRRRRLMAKRRHHK